MDNTNKEMIIQNFLNSIPTGKTPSADEFLQFKKKIAGLINLDLTNYKNNQMERRITSLMFKIGVDNLNNYYQLLKTDSKRLDEFINMLTINVSEFFRNPEKFQELETKYLPEIAKKSTKIKIWSAGCSIGAEIYSVAMILDRLNLLDRADLLASDFDTKIIQKAKEGIYNKMEMGTVKNEYQKYFHDVSSDHDKFQVDRKITSRVRFERCDLLNSRFERDFDLILCRNVVIYFTEEAKDKLYADFYNSLKPGGILFIGSTERINSYKNIGFTTPTPFFYQK